MLEVAMVWIGRVIGVALVALFVFRVMVHIKGGGTPPTPLAPPVPPAPTPPVPPPPAPPAPTRRIPVFVVWAVLIPLVLILAFIGLKYFGIDVFALVGRGLGYVWGWLTGIVSTADWQGLGASGKELGGSIGAKVNHFDWNELWNTIRNTDPGSFEKWFYILSSLWLLIMGQWKSPKFDKDLFAVYLVVVVIAFVIVQVVPNPWERMIWFAIVLIANRSYPLSGFVILVPLYFLYTAMFG